MIILTWLINSPPGHNHHLNDPPFALQLRPHPFPRKQTVSTASHPQVKPVLWCAIWWEGMSACHRAQWTSSATKDSSLEQLYWCAFSFFTFINSHYTYTRCGQVIGVTLWRWMNPIAVSRRRFFCHHLGPPCAQLQGSSFPEETPPHLRRRGDTPITHLRMTGKRQTGSPPKVHAQVHCAF